jgi:dienelactone hydrolase
VAVAALGVAGVVSLGYSQEKAQPAPDGIEREKLYFAGWDPDESVPAYVYYKKGTKGMPVVIFCHGFGGSKDNFGQQMQDLANKGIFVVIVDAHMHGERRVPGVFPQGKNLGKLSEDYAIWLHQSAIAHTVRDVSKIIDGLAARSDVDLSRIGVGGVSMGSCVALVTGCKDPRVSVVVGLIGAVDFWYDVTKTPPGPEQDAKRTALCRRVHELVNSNNALTRKASLAPKALFFANGARDDGIDIESVKNFVKDLRPSYEAHPDRLAFLEEPNVGHSVTTRMWTDGTQWFVRHLIEKPVRASR